MKIGKKSKKQVDAIREAVFERDMERCIVSGTLWAVKIPCAGGLTIQHAVGRGMGGSAKYDEADYLRTMCAIHNVAETANADFAQACDRNGWSVPRWVADHFSIRHVPVMYADGWKLLQFGRRVDISDSTAELMYSDIYDTNSEDSFTVDA